MTHDLRAFQDLWEQAVLRSGQSDRLDATTDRAFWERHASHYDERAGSGGERVTLEYLKKIVHPTDSLLDVGAGTGRFALPLSDSVERITAVDHSPDMLRILRRKATAAGIATIDTVEGEWPHVDVEPHDVVIAAWSLYRAIDLAAALTACVAATRRSLVIVGGAGGWPPHRRHVEEICGRWTESTVPAHLYIAGVLWEMGLLADACILPARRRVIGETPAKVARALAPLGARDADVEKLAVALGSHIHAGDSGFEYLFHHGVGVVTWCRKGDDSACRGIETPTPSRTRTPRSVPRDSSCDR